MGAWGRAVSLTGLFLLGSTGVLLSGGCAGAGSSESGGPPEQLPLLSEQEVLAARAEKDREYKSDPDSPIPPEKRETFERLSYYPYDASWRFTVRLVRYDDPIPFAITTTEGVGRPAVKVGTVSFERGGQVYQLQVYSLRDLPAEAWDSLFLPFLDATSGKQTYGAGRYVELAKASDDWYVLDFNLSYNPLCAYGRTIYRCPATPRENRLPIAVEAGERGWGPNPEQGSPRHSGDSGAGQVEEHQP